MAGGKLKGGKFVSASVAQAALAKLQGSPSATGKLSGKNKKMARKPGSRGRGGLGMRGKGLANGSSGY